MPSISRCVLLDVDLANIALRQVHTAVKVHEFLASYDTLQMVRVQSIDVPRSPVAGDDNLDGMQASWKHVLWHRCVLPSTVCGASFEPVKCASTAIVTSVCLSNPCVFCIDCLNDRTMGENSVLGMEHHIMWPMRMCVEIEMIEAHMERLNRVT
jgi:hypothetical protein